MVTNLVTIGSPMAGKVRHLINRSGRYHARLVVPKALRGIVGKTELREPLGADYRQALKLLPGAVARLQHEIALAEQKAHRPKTDSARYPLTPDQLAYSHYMQRLDFDDELRNDPRYAMVGIDCPLPRQSEPRAHWFAPGINPASCSRQSLNARPACSQRP